jgi:hypothetical protein
MCAVIFVAKLEGQMNEFLIGAPGSPVQVQRQPKSRGLGHTIHGFVVIYYENCYAVGKYE